MAPQKRHVKLHEILTALSLRDHNDAAESREIQQPAGCAVRRLVVLSSVHRVDPNMIGRSVLLRPVINPLVISARMRRAPAIRPFEQRLPVGIAVSLHRLERPVGRTHDRLAKVVEAVAPLP